MILFVSYSPKTEVHCPPGEELVEGTCTSCRSGFYKSQTGNEMCQECPTNTEGIMETGSTAWRKLLHLASFTSFVHKEFQNNVMPSLFLQFVDQVISLVVEVVYRAQGIL